MKTVLLWMLINVSDGAYNAGNVSVIARFLDVHQCEATRVAIITSGRRAANSTTLRCIQAEVVQ